MTDPYEVLNVPNTASDDEVKKAYRDLARKYHPDNYHDNPLADLAQEKMKEINAAYDAIQKERSRRGGYARQEYGSYQRQQSGDPAYERVREAINRGELGVAEQMLEQMGDHNGEWNFLKGTICYRRGWVDEARRYYQTACQMDPGNLEYRQTLNFVENRGGGYRPQGYDVYSTGCVGGNLCARMACTYLICQFCTCGSVRFLYC